MYIVTCGLEWRRNPYSIMWNGVEKESLLYYVDWSGEGILTLLCGLEWRRNPYSIMWIGVEKESLLYYVDWSGEGILTLLCGLEWLQDIALTHKLAK